MVNDLSHQTSYKTSFDEVRTRAKIVWQGSLWLRTEKLQDEIFVGWRNLSLELRGGRADRIECRSVYANLLDTAQQVIVLRSVFWDGVLARKKFKEEGENYNLLLPARFIQLPVMQLEQWLAEFKEIKIPLVEPESVNDDLSIKGLKIQQSYQYRIFENFWRSQNIEYEDLNQKWGKVWLQMTELLNQESLSVNFQEDFPFLDFDYKYDFDTYDSNHLQSGKRL